LVQHRKGPEAAHWRSTSSLENGLILVYLLCNGQFFNAAFQAAIVGEIKVLEKWQYTGTQEG
tara:strand:- start:1181 stop:1366 length:186 start_codon:yes stop_codon:yes gene_type:complete